MKKVLVGILIGACLPAAGFYVFLISGGMPVATHGAPLPMERFIAGTALRAAMKGQIDRPSPVPADEPNTLKGAQAYVTHCAVCHGVPQSKPSAIAQGLFPKPPQLFAADEGVTDDPVGETYWKVKNGIRLTGMPGFVNSLSETELWQISELVAHADKLAPSVQKVLQSPGSGPVSRD